MNGGERTSATTEGTIISQEVVTTESGSTTEYVSSQGMAEAGKPQSNWLKNVRAETITGSVLVKQSTAANGRSSTT